MFSRLDETRRQLAERIAKAIAAVAGEAERLEIIGWLGRCRDILASDRATAAKFAEIYKMIEGRRILALAFDSALAGAKSYRDLPLPVRLALPTTLIAAPFVGLQGAGVAAFGSAIGVPVIVLIFLGSAGVTSIIDALTRGRPASAYLMSVAEFLARDDVMEAIRSAIARGEQSAPEEPQRAAMPAEAAAIASALLSMDPFAFESHVMSFFRDAGMISFVTRRSGDMGIDGVARHPAGAIVVQCKRYAVDNAVGRPDVQKFWGAVEQFRAWRGIFVTTSRFTAEAREAAAASNGKLDLAAMDDLLRWHAEGLSL